MKKTKEIGYELGNVYWNNLKGFKQLWNKADTETKDNIVNGIGELAVKLVSDAATKNEIALHLPVVTTHFYYFDCWDKTGELQTKEIKATCKEHAILLFEKEFGETHKYDPPYN